MSFLVPDGAIGHPRWSGPSWAEACGPAATRTRTGPPRSVPFPTPAPPPAGSSCPPGNPNRSAPRPPLCCAPAQSPKKPARRRAPDPAGPAACSPIQPDSARRNSMLTEHKTLDELAGEIATALGDLDPAGQRLAIALYRLLAAGRPVAVADLAAAAGLPEPEVAGALDGWPAVFTDSRGRITGFWGPGDHRAVPGAPVRVRRAGPVRLVRLGHPLPTRQARAGGPRDLGLPGHRRADPPHRHPGGHQRDLAPGGGRVIPKARLVSPLRIWHRAREARTRPLLCGCRVRGRCRGGCALSGRGWR
jgi:hypothetical protein